MPDSRIPGSIHTDPHTRVAGPDSVWRIWVALTLAASVLATAGDATLLQLRRSYFTGGFLAADHVTSPVQGLAFLLAAFIAEATLIGASAAVALWACGRLGLTRASAVVVAVGASLLPLGIANLVAYRLLSYVGDLFDFGLMFDLAGRSVGEVLAVSWPQVAQGVLAAAGAVTVVGIAAWMLNRRPGRRLEPLPGRTALALATMLIGVGTVTILMARGGSDVLDNGLRRMPAGRFLGAIVNVLSDVDRDGAGLLGRPPDPDLFNAAVRPYALEVPGNGVDENGIGGDLPAGLPPYREPAPLRSWQSTPDVVLIVLESFRADVVGEVVNGRPVTPVLSELAERGVLVEDAYSHNGYTVQSREHIFSGSVAGLHRGKTLLDDFAVHGYETAYFSGQDESFGGPAHGVGFDRADVAYDARQDVSRRYSTFTTAGSLAVPHDVLTERLSEFLRTRRQERPLFLYVNIHDTHFPYHHHALEPLLDAPVLGQRDIAAPRARELRAMYLNAAANVDRAIGRVLSDVTSALGREPGVIVLSDHGESLFDEGFLGHGYALNDAQTRIPLIVSALPLVIPVPFGQADLRTSINDALANASGDARPTLHHDPTRRVFQYLGNLERPRQIGFLTTAGRLLYDMRSRRASVRGGRWMREDDLQAGERAEILDLIHTWERMVIARSAALVESPETDP